MSLDVYLYEPKTLKCECGKVHEYDEEEVFWQNVTHNLAEMAREAGIYDALWHPENIKATKAKHISKIVEVGLERLKNDPDRFEKLNPKNGWGAYSHFVKWVEKYLEALNIYPEANLRVSV